MAKRRRRHKTNSKMNVPMTMAMVLLYLTIFSIYLSSGLYAKYTTSSSGQDGARVITFGGLTLEETGDFMVGSEGKREFMMIPGVNLKKDVKISFDGSEADTYIFVAADMPGWETKDHVQFSVMSKPDADATKTLMTMSIDADEDGAWTYLTTDGTTHVYYRVLESNEALDQVPLICNLKNSVSTEETYQIEVNKLITKKDLEKIQDALEDGDALAMNITAYAAQAGGFNNATDAWESVSKK